MRGKISKFLEIKTFLNNPCIKKEVWREIRYFEPKDNKIQHIKICGMELKQFKRKQKMKKSFLAHVMSPVLYPDIETKIEQKRKLQPISFIDIDVKILNKVLANQTQKYIKRIK